MRDISSIIILTNEMIVPLYPKYLKNIAHIKPLDAKITRNNALTIWKKESFKYTISFLIHENTEAIRM